MVAIPVFSTILETVIADTYHITRDRKTVEESFANGKYTIIHKYINMYPVIRVQVMIHLIPINKLYG